MEKDNMTRRDKTPEAFVQPSGIIEEKSIRIYFLMPYDAYVPGEVHTFPADTALKLIADNIARRF